MRILYYSPSGAMGGATISLIETINYMHERGHEIYVAMPQLNDKLLKAKLMPLVKDIFYIRYMPWHKAPKQFSILKKTINYCYRAYHSGWHLIPVLKMVWLILKYKIKIVHTNTSMAIDPAIAAIITGTPHIYHIREVSGYNPFSIASFYFQKHTVLFRNIMGFFHSRIIVNSDFVKKYMTPYLPQKKTLRIYNPFNEKIFTDQVYLPIDPKKKIIIGTLANVTSAWKNHIYIIEVARNFVYHYPNIDIEFHIYGKTPDPPNCYFQNLLNTIEEYDLKSFVHFKGFELNIDKVFSSINFLMHPCQHEPFGRIFIEAMAKKIPIIAVRGGGASELIRDRATGFLVQPEQPDLTATLLYSKITQPENLNIIVEHAFQNAKNTFMSQKVLTQLEDQYFQLTST